MLQRSFTEPFIEVTSAKYFACYSVIIDLRSVSSFTLLQLILKFKKWQEEEMWFQTFFNLCELGEAPYQNAWEG